MSKGTCLEGPEIKLSTEYLSKTLENKIILNWVFLDSEDDPPNEESNRAPEGIEEFYRELPLICEQVYCKGKFIFFNFFNEFSRIYVIHSIKNGGWSTTRNYNARWYISSRSDTDKVAHPAPLGRRSGSKKDKGTRLWFHDSGDSTLYFTRNENEIQTIISGQGLDILTNIPLDTFKALVETHKTKNITVFLTDQKILSGIGNYLKSEILYYAKISPYRMLDELYPSEIEKLYEAIKIIPRISYNYKGLSSKNRKGNFDSQLKVYKKSNSVKEKTPDSTITYWCPREQE